MSKVKLQEIPFELCYAIGPKLYHPFENGEKKLKQIRTVKKWFSKVLASRRLIKRIPQIVSIFYSPGCKGSYFAEREYNNKLKKYKF